MKHNHLCEDEMTEIFSFLDPNELLLTICKVCNEWKKIVAEGYEVWWNFSREHLNERRDYLDSAFLPEIKRISNNESLSPSILYQMSFELGTYLATLNLSGCKAMTDDTFEPILQCIVKNKSKLTYLNLSNCVSISDKHLKPLLKMDRALEQSIRKLRKQNNEASNVETNEDPLYKEIVDHIEKIQSPLVSSIRMLNLSYCKVPKAILRSLLQLNHHTLQIIDIRGLDTIFHLLYSSIHPLPFCHLQTLVCGNSSRSQINERDQKALECIPALTPNLKHLHIERMPAFAVPLIKQLSFSGIMKNLVYLYVNEARGVFDCLVDDVYGSSTSNLETLVLEDFSSPIGVKKTKDFAKCFIHLKTLHLLSSQNPLEDMSSILDFLECNKLTDLRCNFTCSIYYNYYHNYSYYQNSDRYKVASDNEQSVYLCQRLAKILKENGRHFESIELSMEKLRPQFIYTLLDLSSSIHHLTLYINHTDDQTSQFVTKIIETYASKYSLFSIFTPSFRYYKNLKKEMLRFPKEKMSKILKVLDKNKPPIHD